MLAVTLTVALAVIGSSPALLEKVPPQFRGTVAAFGDGAARLSGAEGGLLGSDDDDTAAVTPYPAIEALPEPGHGEWAPRRPEEFPPPAGLTRGVDYEVETTTEGNITHWPYPGDPRPHLRRPTRQRGRPDLGRRHARDRQRGCPLALRRPRHRDQRDADGTISVYYGDHLMFGNPEVAGVGGVAAYPNGLVLRGSVTLKPGQITSFPGDPWSRSLSLHELMHAVGVGHAADHRDEIMTSRRMQRFRTELGAGDRFALHAVGCP